MSAGSRDVGAWSATTDPHGGATTALQPVAGESAWIGSELARSRDWIWEPDWPGIERGDPAAIEVVGAIARSLEHGRGVALLRGFPLDGEADALRARFLAFASRLGTPVIQNQGEGRLRDIRDTGGPRVESPAALNWHNDRADRVGLLTLSQPAQGGASRIVSATAVHDRLLAERPDLVRALYEPYPRSSPGDEVGAGSRVYTAPVFTRHEGAFSCDLSRTYIEQAQDIPEVPRLSEAQREALDRLFETADTLGHEHELRPGDVQLLNNHVILHGRTAYRDDEASGRRRHLLRVWLAVTGSARKSKSDAALWST